MASEKPRMWNEVFDEEIVNITLRRTVPEPVPVKGNLVGLALSGGGIRSATFGLGVLEGLKSFGLLKKIDYLSTVSGGGYIGAWLSANCKRAAERKAAPNKAPPDPDGKAAYERASINWLDKSACWNDSIAHLRRYSNYLSPEVGFFSADTWSMATIWIRNTLLVQLTVILAIAMVLLPARPLFDFFQKWPQVGHWRWTTVVLFVLAVAGIAGNLRINSDRKNLFLRSTCWPWGLAFAVALFAVTVLIAVNTGFDPFTDGPVNWLAAAPIALLVVLTGFCLLPVGLKLLSTVWLSSDSPQRINYTQGWVQTVVVVPLMATGYLFAAILWGQTLKIYASGELAHLSTFGGFFTNAWRYWPFPLSVGFASLWLLSFCSIRGHKDTKGVIAAFFAPIPAMLVLYALLCGIMLLLHGWARPQNLEEGKWLAFVWAPAMVLYAFSVSIVMLIGMLGRQSTEGVREWWSRLGAWLGIYGFAWMLITVAAVYGPRWAGFLLDKETWKGSTVIGGWLATTLAGLFAGKSGSTSGKPKSAKSERTTTEKLLNVVAIIGPYVFIAGLLIAISTGIHLIILLNSGDAWDGFKTLHGGHWGYLSHANLAVIWALMGATLACLLLLAARVDINEFSLNAFYRSRLSRCYLGAACFLPGERNPQRFTKFDEKDDMPMAALGAADNKLPPAGPLHIVNCALNLGGSSDLALHTRHSASFTLSPYVAGSNYESRDDSEAKKHLGYQPIATYGGRDGQPTLGQAISVSGAAASPNMGYHTSPVVAFLLTVFNVRLGWWFPNPHISSVKSPSPWFSLRYLVKELFGGADDKSNYLMISDGGHFENLAAYELIRRHCRVIIISDAECDIYLRFGGLGSLIRMCEVDLGARITIDLSAIRPDADTDWNTRGFAIGEIDYGTGIPKGVLIYLKASMTGKEGSAVQQYKASHPDFPHESTGDQFYGEDQFESYRTLGREIVESIFKSVNCERDLVAIATDLRKQFPPASESLTGLPPQMPIQGGLAKPI